MSIVLVLALGSLLLRAKEQHKPQYKQTRNYTTIKSNKSNMIFND